MKETKKQTIVVTEYTTDFGTKCPNKDLCRACENQEYKNVYYSLYNIANETQRILLDAIMDELALHVDDNYCERDVLNNALRELVIEERNLGPYNVDC